jgi:hypothetical protein
VCISSASSSHSYKMSTSFLRELLQSSLHNYRWLRDSFRSKNLQRVDFLVLEGCAKYRADLGIPSTIQLASCSLVFFLSVLCRCS